MRHDGHLSALRSISCLSSAYIAGSHNFRVLWQLALAGLANEKQCQEMIARERKSYGILPLLSASLASGSDCVSHTPSRPIFPWSQLPSFPRLVLISVQWHWWLVSDSSSLSSSLSKYKNSIIFTIDNLWDDLFSPICLLNSLCEQLSELNAFSEITWKISIFWTHHIVWGTWWWWRE